MKPLNWNLHLIIPKSQAIFPDSYFNLKLNSFSGVLCEFASGLRDSRIVFTVCLLTTPALLVPVGDFHRLQVCWEVGEGGRWEDDSTQQHSAPSQLKPKQIFWGRNILRVAHLMWGYKDVWNVFHFQSSCCCLLLDRGHLCCRDKTWRRWCKWESTLMYVFILYSTWSDFC